MDENKNPVVFISYSQDTVPFADKVLSLSNRLRSEGIDAILDQYEEAPAEGWPRWMENNIDSANYVIVIGSKGYYDKIYGNVEQGKGRGVKWEGNLIYQKLYMSDSINEKFIPVVFDEIDFFIFFSFSSGSMVQGEYTSVPPVFTYLHALLSISDCILGRDADSEGDLYLSSGFFASTPKPEQGTSQSTLSALPISSGMGVLPSQALVSIMLIPRRSAPERTRESLFS